MKLLIITQKVDKNDPILGFFHRWIEEFAKHCEQVTVICLEEGDHEFYSVKNAKSRSKNSEEFFGTGIKVLSLGKELTADARGLRRRFTQTKYILRFYCYIWRERKNYESVFVHMNQEYVLLGGLLWKFFGKKVMMWRNHKKGNILTRLAVVMSDKVFCTSIQSFTAKFKKAKIMPVGIDIDFFKPDPSVHKKTNSILFLGRIAPVKNLDIFVEALNELQKQGVELIATIAGTALPKDIEYEKIIQDRVLKYGMENKVHFTGAVTQLEALDLYRRHEVYVNLTSAGSMDKTIFEAMACGIIPMTYNDDLKEILGEEFTLKELNAGHIAGKIKRALKRKKDRNFRDKCVEEHSLEKLTDRLFIEEN